MRSYAATYSYYIVANGRGDSYDMLGQEVQLMAMNVSDGSVFGHKVIVAKLNMDIGLCEHGPDQVQALQRDYRGRIESRAVVGADGWTVLNARTLQLRHLMRLRGIHTKREAELESRILASSQYNQSSNCKAANANTGCRALISGK